MNYDKKFAQKIVSDYTNLIYGFALKRTATLEDAEDLTQDIILKLYQVLLVKEDIENLENYIWRAAHNVLANYYRGKSRCGIGISIDEISEVIENDKENIEELYEKNETIAKLKGRIAYLSKLQRQIVIMYYYEGKNQKEMAELLEIPSGTVKWHLFEAKKELKKGMENMRDLSDLKFNPIKFSLMGVNGSIGAKGSTSDFFRSSLSQNIAYAVYREAKTINEISDLLSVSPTYIQGEVEYLEEYGFLLKLPSNKYIANILIDDDNENTEKVLELKDKMYGKAASLISNEVFDELIKSDLLNSDDIYYPNGDKNFLMWTLIFYVLSQSEMDDNHKISFEEVAPIRKDGGQYIAYASVENNAAKKDKMLPRMNKWCGPMWNDNGNILMWQINTEWCSRKNNMNVYAQQSRRDMSLIYRFIKNDVLSSEEYAYLTQNGYIAGNSGNYNLNIVWLKNNDIRQRLLQIGADIKMKYKAELDEVRGKFEKAILEDTPKHLKKMQGFGLQYIFKADGWFLLYSAYELLKTGRLKEVKNEQRIMLTTLVISK